MDNEGGGLTLLSLIYILWPHPQLLSREWWLADRNDRPAIVYTQWPPTAALVGATTIWWLSCWTWVHSRRSSLNWQKSWRRADWGRMKQEMRQRDWQLEMEELRSYRPRTPGSCSRLRWTHWLSQCYRRFGTKGDSGQGNVQEKTFFSIS